MRILRGLSSTRFACGCVAGVYETSDGRVVVVIDAVRSTCTNEVHVRGKVVPADDMAPMIRSTSSDPR